MSSRKEREEEVVCGLYEFMREVRERARKITITIELKE